MKKEGKDSGVWGLYWGWGFLQEETGKTLQLRLVALCKQKAGFVCLQRKGGTLSSSSTSGNINSHCRLSPCTSKYLRL